MGKNEDKMTLRAMERLRKERENKGKKKSYTYSHIKDLREDDVIRKIEMKKKGGKVGYSSGGYCRGGGAATKGTKYNGSY